MALIQGGNMGLFDGLKKSFKKVAKFVEDDIIEPVAKDAIPMTAAYFTNGQSLAVLPPSKSGIASKITEEVFDVNAQDLTKGIMGGIMGGGSSQPQQPQQAQPVVRKNVGTQSSKVIASMPQRPVAQQQQIQKSVAPSQVTAQVGANSPQLVSNQMDTQKMMMIGGGLLIGIGALFLLTKKK